MASRSRPCRRSSRFSVCLSATRRLPILVVTAALVLAAGSFSRRQSFRLQLTFASKALAGCSLVSKKRSTFNGLTQLFAERRGLTRKDSSDGGFDMTFSVIADDLIASMPVPAQEKEAYDAYRRGMAAQTSGDLESAVFHYTEALRLEEDPVDLSYIMYNLGICFAKNGEFSKAVKYYNAAIVQNDQLSSAYNNCAIVYHRQGERAERNFESERADALYDKAADYWNQACRIAPNMYRQAQDWLLQTGRGTGGW
eukprot:TRINITY_DN38187_c0_g1_i1.p1 TRINITY_DN38187_c0_g1~~TRINITY_DN38187_c0_g1_i1.p1  ORF type:complete len:254 (+),score=39.22 TRINITY_DN38187_c0_g1_i1:168-929(+)